MASLSRRAKLLTFSYLPQEKVCMFCSWGLLQEYSEFFTLNSCTSWWSTWYWASALTISSCSRTPFATLSRREDEGDGWCNSIVRRCEPDMRWSLFTIFIQMVYLSDFTRYYCYVVDTYLYIVQYCVHINPYQYLLWWYTLSLSALTAASPPLTAQHVLMYCFYTAVYYIDSTWSNYSDLTRPHLKR